ncbi:MAG: glucose-1-phosphate thymidylyltransferase RfbA [Myxococcales bacterium]|nr:glucose-1-phosphate thymidylyltransferase RfbA [Myxococcales bacterium]
MTTNDNKGGNVKGIILAGGLGTRLYPLTNVASKQLQPIYNKPMIYYPLTTLILSGVREIMLISSPHDIPRFQDLLGDGSRWGVSLHYATQAEPKGIAEALVIGQEFIGDDSVFLMLGDNLIYGRLEFLRNGIAGNGEGATIFGYRVADPHAFGVVEFDADYKVLSIEEKPAKPRSNWAVPGLYVYGPGAAARAAALEPSARGELEITDLNRSYLADGALKAIPMGRGIAWLDTGTPENLLDAANFVHSIETRTGFLVGSPEEAAFRRGFIGLDAFEALVDSMPKSSAYRQSLDGVVAEARQDW